MPTLGQLLVLDDFESLAAELKRWRTDRRLQALEREKGSGIVLGFVKGLRLSARLIYAIRKNLSGSSLQVDWGHLLDPNEQSFSPECDVIIHQRGFVQEWNGNEKPVMNFKFIRSDKTLAVISCKSLARSIDKKYCTLMKNYVKNILLFVECCPKNSVSSLRRKAKKAGYSGFWYLYSLDEKTGETISDPRIWQDFLRMLKRICEV